MKIMSDEEAFEIRHMPDQQKALCLFATFQNLPFPADDEPFAVSVHAFVASLLDLFDYLIDRGCVYCDVCAMMPPGARVLRRLALQKTSSDRLNRITQLETSLYETGARQVSGYTRATFSRYFKEDRTNFYENLHQHIQTVPRETIYKPNEDFNNKLAPSVGLSDTLSSLNDSEIKFENYQKAKESLEAKRQQDLQQTREQLRADWENLQAMSACDSNKPNVEVEVFLFGITLDEKLLRLTRNVNYETATATLTTHFFPQNSTSPKVDSINVFPIPRLHYQTLLPTNWTPKNNKKPDKKPDKKNKENDKKTDKKKIDKKNDKKGKH